MVVLKGGGVGCCEAGMHGQQGPAEFLPLSQLQQQQDGSSDQVMPEGGAAGLSLNLQRMFRGRAHAGVARGGA